MASCQSDSKCTDRVYGVYVSHHPVKDVFVYMSEHVQLMIAACSYFLKHNGAGAVIIFGLEWLINF